MGIKPFEFGDFVNSSYYKPTEWRRKERKHLNILLFTAKVERLPALCCFLSCKMNGFSQEETNRLEARYAGRLNWFVSFQVQICLNQSGRVNLKGGSMICDNNTATGPSPSDASTIDCPGHTTALCWINRDCPCLLVQGRNYEGTWIITS